VFIVSAPFPQALFTSSLITADAVLTCPPPECPEALLAVLRRFARLGYAALFTAVPYIFTDQRMIRELAPVPLPSAVPIDIIHLRFGPVSAARVLKGAVNVYVADRVTMAYAVPGPLEGLRNSHVLPHAFTHVLYGEEPPQLSRFGGGAVQAVDASALFA
jgi:hypothetical protein